MAGGCDWRRLSKLGGDEDRGGVEDGETASAHSETALAKNPPFGAHEALLVEGETSEGRGGVVGNGLGEGEGALAITASGGRMVNIWSSA